MSCAGKYERLLRFYRFIVFTACILLVYHSAIPQTSQKHKLNPLFAINSVYDLHETDFNLTDHGLPALWITPGLKLSLSSSDVKVSYFSPTKSELWKGLVKNHTYFTSIYLHRISHFFIETDLIWSYKTIVTVSKTLQDEPLLNLRI